MSVLVTGGGGFVGLNLVEELTGRGIEVIALGRYELPAKIRTELMRAGNLSFETGDVRDQELIERICRERSVDAVVHAAVITSNAAREAEVPAEIVSVNVQGTISVLEAARRAACRRVVYVSSGQAYGATHREGSVLEEERSASRPEELYGITKFAAEQTALRLGELWDLDIVSVRLGTVFGAWEFDTGDRDMLSTQLRLARMALQGEEAIFPAHEFWRDWIYSRDVARGLAAVLTAPVCAHRLYHLTSGLDWTGHLQRWAAVLQRAYPRFLWHVASEGETPNVSLVVNRDRSPMSTARIKKDLGFVPRYAPAEAYGDYIGWLQAHEDFIA
jgi:nucleoside-diphosphate-sugar epimerase